MYGTGVPAYGLPSGSQTVQPAQSVSTTQAPSAPRQFQAGKVFIGGLGTDTTNDMIRDYAALWGPLAEVYVMSGKGYAFVTFQRVADAQQFLGQHEHEINGRTAEAKAAVPKDQGGSRLTKKLFVAGIGDLSDESLSNYFSRFGNVVNSVVMRRPDGTSRNYGFVTFDNEMSVEKCLVDTHTVEGRQIEVRRSQTRDSGTADRGGERGGDRSGSRGAQPRTGHGANAATQPMMVPAAMGPMAGMRDQQQAAAMMAMAGAMPPASMMGMPPMGMFGMMPGMAFPGMGPGPGMMPMMMAAPSQGPGMVPNPMLMATAYGGMPVMGPMPGGAMPMLGPDAGPRATPETRGGPRGDRPARGGGRHNLSAGMGSSRHTGGQNRTQNQSQRGGSQRFRPY